jgi:AcrR family transcriptional regulator
LSRSKRTTTKTVAGGERRPLTKERIERAALKLIERDGLAAFSTRKLAHALGCEAMSIYHHYPSKAHLMDALLDRTIRAMPAAPEGGWIERLRSVAHNIRDMALAQPEFFQFMALHRMNTPTALRWLDGCIAMFGAGGFDAEATARLFRSFSYYVMGAALDETAGYANGPSAAEPVDSEAISRDYLNVASVAPFFRPAERLKTFDTGLEMLLDGIAREAKRTEMR